MTTSVGTFSRMVHASRKAMLDVSHSDVAEAFNDAFNLRDGDTIEYERCGANRFNKTNLLWTLGRIVSVSACYANANGGTTASVYVLPLLQDGSPGVTRRLIFVIDKKGNMSNNAGRGLRRVE